MCLRPATAPRGQVLVLREWIVIASPVRVNIRACPDHCRPGCRAVKVTKARLEGLFADELALLQPTPGYMRLLKESVLQIWKVRTAAVREELATAVCAIKTRRT
jgi:hypothetical protein